MDRSPMLNREKRQCRSGPLVFGTASNTSTHQHDRSRILESQIDLLKQSLHTSIVVHPARRIVWGALELENGSLIIVDLD